MEPRTVDPIPAITPPFQKMYLAVTRWPQQKRPSSTLSSSLLLDIHELQLEILIREVHEPSDVVSHRSHRLARSSAHEGYFTIFQG